MKLAVSNIAWTNEEEPAVAALLQKLGVEFIEIAPTKIWQDPTTIEPSETRAYVEFWRSYGIKVVAFQSMLFNRTDLKLFEDSENRTQTLAYLQNFTRLAGLMGAGVMVFGSPKNRQRGNISLDVAEQIAEPFFAEIGKTASENGVNFCIEPNAEQYACDFVTNAKQGIDLVNEVATPGFGLHLDIACMTLAGDDIDASIKVAAPVLGHFHISSPMLGDVKPDTDVDHKTAAAALHTIGYDKYVSIEMRPSQDGDNLARVETAVKFAQSVYC